MPASSGNDSPIFPGVVSSTGVAVAATTATTKTLVTGATDGSVVTAINFFQASAVAVTWTLKYNDGVTSHTLAQGTTPATANYNENILTSEYLPQINDFDPAFVLPDGHSLELQVGSVATTLSVVTTAGDY